MPDTGAITSNIEDAIRGLASANAEVDHIVTAGLRDVANAMKDHAKENWPIDTGHSYAAWFTEVEDLNAAVVCDAEYATYVHDGLAVRLLDEARDAVIADTEAFLSDRVIDLLEGKP